MDWETRPQEPYFGKWRPPLYGVGVLGKDTLVIYPVVISCSGSAGPAFLPIIPSPKAWNHPKYENLLRFVYSGCPEDIHIEMVDDRPVDPRVVEKTKTYDGKTMVSLHLDESLVADGKLVVKLSYHGEEKTLEFEREQFTSFRPLVYP